MKQLEHTEQASLIKWWALAHNAFGVPESCLFAIPNGGERNIVVAAKLKSEGVRAGIPDLFLAVPVNGWNGLFIEMKKKKGGRLSDNQRTMMSIFSAYKYSVAVCHGFIEAKRTIETYLRQGVDNVQINCDGGGCN